MPTDWAAKAAEQRKKMTEQRGQDRLGVIPPGIRVTRDRVPPAQSPWAWRRREAEAASPAGIKREQERWDSMPMYLKDAPLKTDTSIEETLFAASGVPSMVRLFGIGAKAVTGAGREALRSRGIGGWERVTDPGRRQFMKVGAGLAATTVIPPKILMDALESTAKKAAPSGWPKDSPVVALWRKINIEASNWYGKTADYFGGPLVGSSSKVTARRWSQKYLDDLKHWRRIDRKMNVQSEDIINEAYGSIDNYVEQTSLEFIHGIPTPKNPIGDLIEKTRHRVNRNIQIAEYGHWSFGERVIRLNKQTKLKKAIAHNQSGKSSSRTRDEYPTGTTMPRPRHGGGTVPIKIGSARPSPSTPRPGRRSRTRKQRAVEEYQEFLKKRKRK